MATKNNPKNLEKSTIYKKKKLSEKKKKEILKGLCNILGSKNVSNREIDKISYSKDYWPIALRWTLEGKTAALPDYIVWPKNTKQISDVIKLANEKEIPVGQL